MRTNRPDESEREKVSVGTAVLLDYLMSAYPNYKFYFCLGADSFVDLVNGKWQQTDRILNELLFERHTRIYKSPRRIVVLYRSQTKMLSDHDNNSTMTAVATSANTDAPSLSLPHSFDYIESLVQGYRAQLLCMDRAEDNVSSTLVRNCLDVTKLRDNPAIILPEVLQYIEEHKLYQFCK
jgi:nicotinic acid mononucleotide adenylyltransferase